METSDFIAEVISLTFTPLTMYLCFAAAMIFYRSALLWFYKKNRNAIHWFALGVVVSFNGSTVDNTYWGIAWSYFFAQHEYAKWWFDHGVYSNIPFRQFADSFGAYCHIRSAILHFHIDDEKEKVRRLHKHILVSILVGVAYVAWLITLRG